MGKVWEEVAGAVFAAYPAPLEGHEFAHFCYAGNKKHEVQRIKVGSGCAGLWKDTKWENEKQLYVRSVTSGSFCVGTRHDDEAPVSRILRREKCDVDGFSHDFSFEPVDPSTSDQPRS